MTGPGIGEQPSAVYLLTIDELVDELVKIPTKENLGRAAIGIIGAVNEGSDRVGRSELAAFFHGSEMVTEEEITLLERDLETAILFPESPGSSIRIREEIIKRREDIIEAQLLVKWLDQLAGVGPKELEIKKKEREKRKEGVLGAMVSLNEAARRVAGQSNGTLVLNSGGREKIMGLFSLKD